MFVISNGMIPETSQIVLSVSLISKYTATVFTELLQGINNLNSSFVQSA